MATHSGECNKNGGAELYTQIRSPKFSLVYPDLVRRIQEQKAQSLLDYGCGSGAFLIEYASTLNIRQIGYDIDDKMLDIARKNSGSTANTTFVSTLSDIQSGSIDAIAQTALWMVLKTENECLDCLKAIHRLLSSSGAMYMAITHPCFRDRAFSGNILHLNMTDYHKAGIAYQAEIKDGDKTMSLTNYHWSLSAISQQLKNTGFVINELYEYPDVVQPSPGSPWMLIVASKR